MTAAIHTIVIILTVLTAILLIGIVLIQKSKGGGLSSQFGGAGSMMGVRQTNSFLEKATWTLAALILVFSVISAFTIPKASTKTEIRTEVQTQQSNPTDNQFDTNVNNIVPVATDNAAPTDAPVETATNEATPDDAE